MKKSKTPKWLWSTLLLIALVLCGILFLRKPPNTTVQYRTVPLSRGDVIQTVTASGNLSAVQLVTVGSEVSGKIIALYADYNDPVTNGQLIARLDPSTYERQVEQAKAELESAQATLNLQQANFRRAEELLALTLISQADFDSAEASLAQARASLRMREAALSKAEVDLEKTAIFSPINGVVISRAVDEGQTVAASMQTPTLFTIARDLREMRIEAEISEADVGGVAEGQRVNFTVDAYPERTFSGIISQIRFQPITNQNVVNYIAIVDVDNQAMNLLPGMTANASIITAERQNVLRISNAALRFRPPENAKITTPQKRPEAATQRPDGPPPSGTTREARKILYVLADNQTLRPMPVKTGITDGTWTEILETPAEEGSLIVTGTEVTGASSASAPNRTAGASPFGTPMPPRR